MGALTPFVMLAFVALVILALVLMVVEVDISQTRRIERQIARDVRRIRIRTMKGWTEERIAARYPHLPREQIRTVRRAMHRRLAAAEEVGRLEAIWSIEIAEPDYEA